ncbi:MAG TPA: MarR family winged helix-turn-helix transcriptional regulator [Mycobacteriales bacterium]|nr:MarR family winged helix-turn-helix transcriptional regulator [Mycobacteriales bacterium]
MAALEAAISDTWSWARATAKAGAQALDPRLDTTAYPLVSMIGWRGDMRPSELAAALHLDRSTVSRQIDSAARLGLLERVPDPDDARAVTVRLTEPARERMEALKAVRMERWRTALDEWEPGDITELTRLLGLLGQVRLT